MFLVPFSVACLLAGFALLVTMPSAAASPVPRPASDVARRATVDFASSCTSIAYFGYCRIEARCTIDGSPVSDGAELQHTFLDMGQCIGYDTASGQLTWRPKTTSHYSSGYCDPCAQCNIDPKTTEMTCKCQYHDKQDDHATTLKLGDRLFNGGGVLSCMEAVGVKDPHDTMKVTQVQSG